MIANIAIDTPKFVSGEMPPPSSAFAVVVVVVVVLVGSSVQQVGMSSNAQCHEAQTLVPVNIVPDAQSLAVNPAEQSCLSTQQEAESAVVTDNVGFATFPTGHEVGSNVVHGTARVRGSKHIRNTNNDIL